MFLLVTASLILGLILILLINRTSRPVAVEKDFYNQREAGRAALEGLEAEKFEEVCRLLLEKIGLLITTVGNDRKGRIEITALNPQPITGGEYLVHCALLPSTQTIDSATVIALSDAVRAERALKGILITTGYFSEEVSKIFEGSPLELINGKRLSELLTEYHISPA